MRYKEVKTPRSTLEETQSALPGTANRKMKQEKSEVVRRRKTRVIRLSDILNTREADVENSSQMSNSPGRIESVSQQVIRVWNCAGLISQARTLANLSLLTPGKTIFIH
jgi:hypothetical protein